MNQLCKVCGEPAAGFHFGAFTCEGCKSFFGRTYNNISAIAGCKNNGDCVINKKNRTACKACRLRKCLLVGMSKSGSRYGRRSNWFKIHCLLQEQQTTNPNALDTSGTSNGSSSAGGGVSCGGNGGVNNNLTHLARLQQASSQVRQTYQDKTNPCIKSAVALSPTLALQAAAAAAAAAANSTPNTGDNLSNIPNFLHAAKLFNGHHHPHQHSAVQQSPSLPPQMKIETRLSNTPSDSGASSAGDPVDDCTSITSVSRRSRHCNSAQPPLDPAEHQPDVATAAASEHERRRKELLEIFRSHSEPLRSRFASFPLPTSLLACATPTHLHAPLYTSINYKQHLSGVSDEIVIGLGVSVGAENTSNNNHTSGVQTSSTHCADFEMPTAQEEPIDLSLKTHEPALAKRGSSHSPGLEVTNSTSASTTSQLNHCRNESTPVPFVRRSTPLDLTRARSQTTTG